DSIALKLKKNGVICSKRSIYRDLISLEEHFEDHRVELKVIDGEFNRKKWVILNKRASSADKEDVYLQTFLVEHFKPEWMKRLTGNTLNNLLKSNYSIQKHEFNTIANNIPEAAVMHSGWGEFNAEDHNAGHIRDILWAITNNRMLIITQHYHSSLITYTFAPFKLIYHRGTLHIAGWLVNDTWENREFCIREIDLFENVDLTDERFLPKRDFARAIKLLKERFGIHDTNEQKAVKIRLELGDGPARFLSKRTWHPTQRFTKSGNGTWYMDLECALSIELIGWIFSWLEHIKVIKPLSLKKQMQKRAEFISNMYKKDLPVVNPKNTDDINSIGK
ncbi:MAG: helix-turn-helix transcriptional regulator, partial [Methylophilaceae bacterium]